MCAVVYHAIGMSPVLLGPPDQQSRLHLMPRASQVVRAASRGVLLFVDSVWRPPLLRDPWAQWHAWQAARWLKTAEIIRPLHNSRLLLHEHLGVLAVRFCSFDNSCPEWPCLQPLQCICSVDWSRIVSRCLCVLCEDCMNALTIHSQSHDDVAVACRRARGAKRSCACLARTAQPSSLPLSRRRRSAHRPQACSSPFQF